MEQLGRGVVALHFEAGKVLVGWRLLGTDASNIGFNVYRKTETSKSSKLNRTPLLASTSFVDETADLTKQNSYYVRPVFNGHEYPPSTSFSLNANPTIRQYLAVPVKTPEGYTPNDVSVGDLDGDGEYELIVHQVGRGRDNSQAGMTTEPILDAYKLNGTLLWRINLGKNIREGAHYTQFMVYDLDGDGRAEVACKTADGTIDGRGKVIGDPNADFRHPEGSSIIFRTRTGADEKRNVSGYILSGPEYLTIFDGLSGAALATTTYVPPRHRGYESWVRGAGLSGLWNSKGEQISDRTPQSCNFGIWWDGDLLGELLDRNMISKWNWNDNTETLLLKADDCVSNNGTKATPALSADILGDWREEVIWRTSDNKELRIYTTTIPTTYRFYTLMHDPQYRLSVAWQNVAYNQPPHTGFYLGDGMASPPRPGIILTRQSRQR